MEGHAGNFPGVLPAPLGALPEQSARAMQQPPSSEGRGSFQQVHDDTPADDQRHPVGIEQLAQQIRETADKLVRDGAARGDVKLLSTALKELRYSFKVFTSFRNQRKITVFG